MAGCVPKRHKRRIKIYKIAYDKSAILNLFYGNGISWLFVALTKTKH
jgi:hypothetical protein